MKEANEASVTVSIDIPTLSDEKTYEGSNGSQTSDTPSSKPVNDGGRNTEQLALKKVLTMKALSGHEMAKTIVDKQHLFKSPKMRLWVAAIFWSKLFFLRALISFIVVLSLFSLIFAAVFRFGAYKINPFLAEVTTDNPGYLTSSVNFLETVVVLPAFAVFLLDFLLLLCIREDTIVQLLPLLRSWTFVVDIMASSNLLTVPVYVACHHAEFQDALKWQAATLALLLISIMKGVLSMQKYLVDHLFDLTLDERRLRAAPAKLVPNSYSWRCCRYCPALSTVVTWLCGTAFVLLQTTDLQYGAPLLGCVGDDCPRLRVPAVVYYSTCGVVLCNFLYGVAHCAYYWHPNPASIRADQLNRVMLTALLAAIPLPCGYLCQLYRLAVPYTVWGSVFALSLASLFLIALDIMKAFPPASSTSHKLDFLTSVKGCSLRNSPAAAVELLKSLRHSSSSSKESLKDHLIDTSGRKQQGSGAKAASAGAKRASVSAAKGPRAAVTVDERAALIKKDLETITSSPRRIYAGKMFYFIFFLRMVCIGTAAVLVSPILNKMKHQGALDNYEVVTLIFFSYHIFTIVSMTYFMTLNASPYVIYDLKLRYIKFFGQLFFVMIVCCWQSSYAFLFGGLIPTFLEVAYEVYWSYYSSLLRALCCRRTKRSSSAPAPPRAKGTSTATAGGGVV